MPFDDLWWLVLYPAVLTLIQLVVPQTIRRLYLWIGFAFLCTVSVGLALFMAQATELAVVFIALSAAIPVLFAAVRFGLSPLWSRYRSLEVLSQILGAVNWGLNRNRGIDTHAALNAIETSFDFMGFGFSKYLTATPEQGVIQGRSNLEDSLLWKKLEAIYLTSSGRPLRILLMDPLAEEIDKYSRLLKKRYPEKDVREDLYFSLDCLGELQRRFPNLLQVRFYPNSRAYRPSFRLFFCNEGELYVSFYRWGTTGTDLPYVRLRNDGNTFFRPFRILFDYLWEHGQDADLGNMPLTVELGDVYARDSECIARIQRHIRHQLPPQLRGIPFKQLRIAAAAIAGRDSALAIFRIAESGQFDCILPILVGTPEKYLEAVKSRSPITRLGDYQVRALTLRDLRQVIEKQNSAAKTQCHLLNMVFVATDTRLYARIMNDIEEHWRFNTGNPAIDKALMSPCIACHVYIYYLRAMLCRRLGIKTMFGGDRLVHDQMVKVNQMSSVLDAIKTFSREEFDVEFMTPLESSGDNSEVRRDLDAHGIAVVRDVSCRYDGHGQVPREVFDTIEPDSVAQVGRMILSDVVPTIRHAIHELHTARIST